MKSIANFIVTTLLVFAMVLVLFMAVVGMTIEEITIKVQRSWK